MTDPAGRHTSYHYDAKGNLERVTFPDGTTRRYKYENAVFPHHMTSIWDESNNQLTRIEYDSVGRVIMSERAGGADRVDIVYTGNISTVTDALGGVTQYTFTSTSDPPRVRSVSKNGRSRSYRLDGHRERRVFEMTDPAGVITEYDYDGDRLGKKVDAAGTANARSVFFSYATGSSTLPDSIETRGANGVTQKVVSLTYNAQNLPTTIATTAITSSGPVTRTVQRGYDMAGRLTSENGPRTDVADVTTYTYYTCTTGGRCGQLETITNALGHVTTFNTYNADGQPLTITDPNGVVTTLTYDLRRRLTSSTVGTEQTSFEYWPTGLLKKVTVPDGSFFAYTYDPAQRLTQVADSEGNTIVYTLDAMGNRVAEQRFDSSDALTRTRTRIFNNLNQLWKLVGAAGTTNVTTTFAYDDNGNQTGINAPLGRNTTQLYDELNRLRQITDPLLGTTLFAHDTFDHLTSVTDPRGKVTSYTYNALGDLTQSVSPDTGTTVNTYDSGGNLATNTDARSKTGTYAYDALNRVTSLTHPDQTITYTYDTGTNQKGRLTEVSDVSGSTSWSYDAHGRVLTKQQTMSSVSKSVSYAYDSFGRLETLTLPSGNTITYGYTDGKVTSLTLNGSTPLLSNLLYQPFGPTAGWTWGNGTFAVREYDTDGKITDIDSAGLKSYSYDDAFRITGITDAGDPNLSQSYGYDLLDRLTSATGTGLNQGWTYDANGNRLTQTGGDPSTYTISSTNNRITSITGSHTRTYGYDSAGNTTSEGTGTFTYNDAGRMVSATKAGVTITYSLNALGQRVKKASGGASTYFVYDEAGHLVGEYDNLGSLVQETVWFADTPVAVLESNGGSGVNHFYVHTDQLNTPRKISRPSDNVSIWRWDSDPFGTTPASEDPDGDSQPFAFNLRFPGQYADPETGLHYNYFRDYDPAVGRYIQSDPIGLAGGLNPYAYVSGSPVGAVDPLGLSEVDDQIRAVGIPRAIGGLDAAMRAQGIAEQSGLPGPHNGPQDAYRHCLWSCLLAQSMGEQVARRIGDTHEASNKKNNQPQDEQDMDEANNAAGRLCTQPIGPKPCSERCRDLLLSGQLFGLGGKPMPVPTNPPAASTGARYGRYDP